MLVNVAVGSSFQAFPTSKLSTPWTEEARQAAIPLAEYPRPQFVRSKWLILNGQWDYIGGPSLPNPANVSTMPVFPEYMETIHVPFPPESYLSGVMRDLDINMWYRRNFTVPGDWHSGGNNKVLLQFQGIAETAAIFVNGKLADRHTGRWDSFQVDITSWLVPGTNTLVVGANDPHDGKTSCGKGVTGLGDYTFTSGIWQTVWIEPVFESHLSALKITPNVADSSVSIGAVLSGKRGSGIQLLVSTPNGEFAGSAMSQGSATVRIPVPNARLWSPDDPFLYNVQVRLLDRNGKVIDKVTSYFGMRSIQLAQTSDGKLHPSLNGNFTFQYGPLDQGYWPDGIHTAPTDEALKSDLIAIKQLGFNLVRKHAKVEPQRWYYWADVLGLMVWQDMPSLWYPDTDSIRTQFEHEWRKIIIQHYNSPAIVTWVPFNENWGAYDVARVTDLTKILDTSRLVSGNSGYNNAPPYRPPPGDPGNGDYDDTHIYIGPGNPPQPSESRAAALGEFGGVGLEVQGHMWPGVDHNAYEKQPSVEALTSRFEQLCEQLKPLIQDRGLGVAIYTQISDVEHEINGFLTYDRKIKKVEFRRGRAAIQEVIKFVNNTYK